MAGAPRSYTPSRFEGQSDEPSEPGGLQNFVESDDPAMFNFGENLIVAPRVPAADQRSATTLASPPEKRSVWTFWPRRTMTWLTWRG